MIHTYLIDVVDVPHDPYGYNETAYYNFETRTVHIAVTHDDSFNLNEYIEELMAWIPEKPTREQIHIRILKRS